MATVFTRIIEGEIPGTFVWKDERCVGIMSINPIRPGHTLVIPREEIDHWLDCPAELREHLLDVSREIGDAIRAVYGPERIGLVIAGLEVPHLHIHLMPVDHAEDLNFANAASNVERGALEESAADIRYILSRRGAAGVSS